MVAAIRVRGLRKSYGPVEAVKGVNLEVGSGEVFALLGPNGAGKTTTLEILEGYRARDAGEVSVLRHDPAHASPQFRRRIGIVLQTTGVEPFLTVAEAIELYRGFYPSPRPLDEVLEMVGLAERRDARVNRLSGGQQRRLDVAIGLAGDPDLLFLDEPTTGFDPSARRRAWGMVENLKALGKTIVLTTHLMDEAQHLADRVAIMVAGRIVAEGAPDILHTRDRRTRIRFRSPPHVELPGALGAARHDDVVEIATDAPTRTLHDLTSWALAHDVELERLTVTGSTLEDVYLELTGAQAEIAGR